MRYATLCPVSEAKAREIKIWIAENLHPTADVIFTDVYGSARKILGPVVFITLALSDQDAALFGLRFNALDKFVS
jgi:hypothetical protein